jgi:hypothetical protein
MNEREIIEQQCSYCAERLKEIDQSNGVNVPRDLNEMHADNRAPQPEAVVRHSNEHHEEKVIKPFVIKHGLQYFTWRE